MNSRAIRHLWPHRLRTRLAVLYALLFLLAGLALLALTYALLASNLPATGAPVSGRAPAICARLNPKQATLVVKVKGTTQTVPAGKKPSSAGSLSEKCRLAFTAGASAGSQSQRDRALSSLLFASLIGIGVITLMSGALGWFISGRALRPVRAITDAARRASELHLGERLALDGPQDELKELADTFDEMLERLDAAFASQKRFVANAAHELRTPLTAMRTSIEVTMSKPSRTTEQVEAMASKVRRSIERCETTINALLTLATSERGPATQEQVDIATAAEDALDAISQTVAERRLTVNATLDPAWTTGETVLLERLIANLVDNAVLHNNDGGWISVHTCERDGKALFEISNSGPYVAEQAIPSLFEPFGRAEQRLNPVAGVGLGLSIAHAIGTAHGASVLARSRPGGGLDVSVMLPGAHRQAVDATGG